MVEIKNKRFERTQTLPHQSTIPQSQNDEHILCCSVNQKSFEIGKSHNSASVMMFHGPAESEDVSFIAATQ